VEISAKGLPVIQWEKDQTEEAGLVKIDILGNRSLSVIRDALVAVEKNTGNRIDYAAWDPLSDPATQEAIKRGDTMGCFYVESPATRLLIRKLWVGMPQERLAQLKPTDVFEYLVMVSSLVRPATTPFIRHFLLRAQGLEPDDLPHEKLTFLKDTHGIMTYQEDVTRTAMILGDFSADEAEQLRKVLSKKHKERQLRDYKQKFFAGARGHGVLERVIEELWGMIMSFAGYSFCKPHSASYAQVSFKSAWLRVHYPAEFMAGVISNEGGFYSTVAYLSETRRMGLEILPPDINASGWLYQGCARAIRVGLMQIKGLDRAWADRLLAEREDHGPFRSIQDFLCRMSGEPAQTRKLIRAGCFDSIAGELTRPALLWRVHAFRSRASSQLSLEASRLTPAAPVPPEYSAGQRWNHEVESFGFPLSRHPLEVYADRALAVHVVPASEMLRHRGRRVAMLGWFITDKVLQTKHGEPMDFVSFEDTTGLYEATFFPDAYRCFASLLAANQGYLLQGVIEEDFGTVALIVQHLELLEGDRKVKAAHRDGEASACT